MHSPPGPGDGTLTPASNGARPSCFTALVHNSRSRSIIALHPEIRGPAMTSFKRTQRKYVQKAYRVRNWREYETGLRARGSLTAYCPRNPIDAVRRADSTLDARRVATFVTAESLCSARPVCRLFPQVLQFLVVAVAGWINQQQRDVIDSFPGRESRPPRAARSGPSPVHRRPAPAPGRTGQAPRATGTP